MLQSRALLSRAQIQVGCGGALLLSAATVSAVESAVPTTAPGASAVSADVRWSGLCNNRAALERAMRERGAQLEKPGSTEATPGYERFTVDVDVSSSSGPHAYAARFEIQGASGTRDVREVEAATCEELNSAVAWVLVVLARGPRGLDENNRESGATTESKDSFSVSGPVPATGSALSSAAPAFTPRGRSLTQLPASVRLVYGSVVPKAEPRFAIGAQLVGGWGLVPEPAWGPAVFFDYRPLRAWPLGLRLAALSITSDVPSSDSTIDIAVRRTSARLGAWFRVPKMPFSLTGGLEAGSLSARGTGSVVSQQGRSKWGAAFAGILVDFPVLRDRLWLEAAADVSLSPYTYAFRTSSQRTVVESEPIELRTAIGLKSSF